jgi:hypothetical protein
MKRLLILSFQNFAWGNKLINNNLSSFFFNLFIDIEKQFEPKNE